MRFDIFDDFDRDAVFDDANAGFEPRGISAA
jgi:hypothetical protein